MNSLPQRDYLLMTRVTGPLTLAARITQLENKKELLSEDLSDAALELAASTVTQVSSAFLEAGADLILIQEEMLPVFSDESCDSWANLLAPTINLARFYEALPVLQIAPTSTVGENCDAILRQKWDCVVCLPLEVVASRRSTVVFKTNPPALGIALPLEAFQQAGPGGKDLHKILRPLISELQPAIITTAGDVPATTDMKRLAEVLRLEGK